MIALKIVSTILLVAWPCRSLALSPPTVVLVVPSTSQPRRSQFGTRSPVDPPTFRQAAEQLAKKLSYYCQEDDENGTKRSNFRCSVESADAIQHPDAAVLIAMGLDATTTTEEEKYNRSSEKDDDDDDLSKVRRVFDDRRRNHDRMCHFAIDCQDATLPAMVGPYDTAVQQLPLLLPWTQLASAQRLHDQMQDLFQRWTTDDFCYAVTLFLNQYVAPVDWVRHRTDATWEKGPWRNIQEFYAMATQCGPCLQACLQDEQCRTCLSELTRVDPRDQVNSYRTIVSYESDLLTNVSLCMFTKKNIFQCHARIPTQPVVPPLARWRGQPVTPEVGRQLLKGHWSPGDPFAVSWKVACGANVAYDQFPNQNQLFYSPSSPGASSRTMWYDPVFRVETLDGRHVWCKRHYRVQQQTSNAATFRLSVSDNGVTSDEFWTIVGAADDLSWIVFHYAGAAKTIGQRYLGGLLCTADGSLPANSVLEKDIWPCIRAAGMEPWELYPVDNRNDTPGAIAAGPPPLTYYRDLVAEKKKREAIQ